MKVIDGEKYFTAKELEQAMIKGSAKSSNELMDGEKFDPQMLLMVAMLSSMVIKRSLDWLEGDENERW